MKIKFIDGNKSIKEKNHDEFQLCKNHYLEKSLKPPIKVGQCYCFEVNGQPKIIVGIKNGTTEKIEEFDNYIECYKKYKCPKQIGSKSQLIYKSKIKEITEILDYVYQGNLHNPLDC